MEIQINLPSPKQPLPTANHLPNKQFWRIKSHKSQSRDTRTLSIAGDAPPPLFLAPSSTNTPTNSTTASPLPPQLDQSHPSPRNTSQPPSPAARLLGGKHDATTVANFHVLPYQFIPGPLAIFNGSDDRLQRNMIVVGALPLHHKNYAIVLTDLATPDLQ